MSIFGLFGKGTDMKEGLERYHRTKGAVLLDVRTKEEFAGGHIPGSQNLPLQQVDTCKYPKEKELFVYCQSGMRSRQACARLKAMGYQATDLGGIVHFSGKLER